MDYREHPPAPALTRYVKCYWTLHGGSPSSSGAPDRILPDGCTEWIMQLGDPMAESRSDDGFHVQPREIIVGQTTRPFVIRPTGCVATFGVRFWPAASAALLPSPCYETDVAIDATALLGREGCDVQHRLREARDDRARCALMDAYLAQRVSIAPPGSWQMLHACHQMLGQHGRSSIEALARDLGLSRRQFERRFLASVGIAPKLLARIVRFRTVFGHVERLRHRVRWADIAASAGYYDQSHLVRDFQQFAGASPREYSREPHMLANAILGVG